MNAHRNGIALLLCLLALPALAQPSRQATEPQSANRLLLAPVNHPPQVALYTPTNGQTFTTGATVQFQGAASDSDPGDAISSVQYLVDGIVVATLPGQLSGYTYSHNWTATTGSHTVQIRATDSFEMDPATTTSPARTISVLAPTNDAAFVAQSVPTAMVAGQNYTVGVTMRNTGTATWTSAGYYSLGSANPIDNTRWGTGRVGLPASIAPGQDATFGFVVTAPVTPGNYSFQWQMVQDGVEWFGALTTDVTVSVATAPPPTVARTYTYNAYQELCRIDEPEIGSTLLGFEGAGNLKWSAAGLSGTPACEANGTSGPVAARRVDRTYDARNRIATLAFPDANGNQAWSYTADGLPAIVATANGATTATNYYSYNKRRLLTAETLSESDYFQAWALGYGYDANGHLASLVYPSQLTVTYLPNALGQPTRVASDTQVFASNVSYYPNGAIAAFTYGNGIVHSLSQNARQLPARSQDVDDATPVHDDTYAYDANGNVAAINDGVAGNRGNQTMTYDALDRLLDVTSPMYGTTGAHYTYDVLDNLTSVTAPSTAADGTHAHCYDASNRLANVKVGSCGGATVASLGYDVQGNLTSKGGTTYVFDYGNRLRMAATESYRYDAWGRRIRSTSPTGLLFTQYTQAGQPVWVRDERTQQRRQYVYLGGSLIAERTRVIGNTAEIITYQHTDALGSPVAKTSSARTVMERSEYEPYGYLLNRPLTDGAGYTGHLSDAATGLVNMQQRYYDPLIGRFLSVDPVSVGPIGDNFNRYWYANNNPYTFSDPDGRIGYKVGNTIYIPVTFRGSGVSHGLIHQVVDAASRLVTQDGTRIVVVPVSKVMGGVNVMNISPGLTRRENSTYGEGIVKGPGVIPNSGAHIDSTRSDLVGAILHDTLHFAQLPDRYIENSNSTFGNRGESTPLPGFEDSIMGSTSGNMLYQEETQQFQDAFNGLYGEKEWEKLRERIHDNDQ